METVFIAFETNIWHADPTYVCVGSSIDECIKLIKKNNQDLIKNVITKQSHVIINKVTVNEYESDTRVLDTSYDDNFYLLVVNGN